MAERLPRIGTTFQIAFKFTFPTDTPNAITAVAVRLYDSAGTEATAAGSPFTGTPNAITANVEYRPFYNLATSSLTAGDYTGRFVYTSTNPLDDDEFEFTLLPVVSKYDRWIRRVRRWLSQASLSESQGLLSYRAYMDAVNAAVNAYSQSRPRVVEWEQVLTANDWTYALPAGWVTGYSQILRPEYPYDATLQGRTYLLPSDLDVDEADSILFLVNHTPSTGQTFRFLYLGIPTLDHTTDNLPAFHFEAVSCRAAAEACKMLAVRAAGTDAPSIVAGEANYRDQAARYTAVARMLETQAAEMWRDRRVYV